MSKRRKKRKRRYHHGEYSSKKTGQLCKYRSEWEFKFMKYLDENCDVLSWSYEQIPIEYISNIRTKKIRRYYPDFLVNYRDGRSEVVEIKPKYKTNQAIVKKKADAANNWCNSNGMIYKIITEADLKELGLL